MKKNFLKTRMHLVESCHGGRGTIARYKLWDKSDFQGNWDFFDRITVPAGASIGCHRHGHNEEMYIVLKGSGSMTLGNETFQVQQGDMLLNPPNGEHGLVNDSNQDIDLLIVQVGMNK